MVPHRDARAAPLGQQLADRRERPLARAARVAEVRPLGAEGAAVMWSGADHAAVMWSGAEHAAAMWSGAKHAVVMWSGAEHTPVMRSGAKHVAAMGSGVEVVSPEAVPSSFHFSLSVCGGRPRVTAETRPTPLLLVRAARDRGVAASAARRWSPPS